MASNYSSYSTPYSPQYAPYVPYAMRPATNQIRAGVNTPRMRSQSFNDLPSAFNQSSSYYCVQRPYIPYTSPVVLQQQYAQPNSAMPRANTVSTANNSNTALRSQSNSQNSGTPATLSRYRGRHIRAHSAGSLNESSAPNFVGENVRRTGYNASISSSEASVDSDSLCTQTSVSSVGSIHSSTDDEILAKQTKFGRSSQAIANEKQGSIVGSQNLAPTAELEEPRKPSRDPLHAPEDGGKTSKAVESIKVVDSHPKNDKTTSEQSTREKTQRAQAGTTTFSSKLVLPSDVRLRAQRGGSSADSKNFQPPVAELTRKAPVSQMSKGSQNSPLKMRNIAPTAPSEASISRGVPSASATARHEKSFSVVAPRPARQAPDTTITASHQRHNSVPGLRDFKSSASQPQANFSRLHQQSEAEATVPRSKSFGSKLRDFLKLKDSSSSDKKDNDDDTRSIVSSRSNFSIRSSKSIASIKSKFRFKKSSVVDTDSLSVKSVPAISTTTTEPQHNNVVMPRPPSPALRSAISSFEPPMSAAVPAIPALPEIPITPKLQLDSVEITGKNEDSPVTDSPVTDSPVTDSLVTDEAEPAKDDEIECSNRETAPPNLSAGDIFPGSLKVENIETIVSSVERTGSFKRQPSTSKRTPDEVVPNAEEIEADTPSNKEETTRKLASAMKSSRTGPSRKRSGATKGPSVSFASQILVYKTYSSYAYDRTPDRMTCDLLSQPGVAQRLREELNQWKMLMEVHPDSLNNTQFFQV